MNLESLWLWETKKMPYKLREETGNPAVDELRERMTELARIDLTDAVEEYAVNADDKKSKRGLDHRSSSTTLQAEVELNGSSGASVSSISEEQTGDTSRPHLQLEKEALKTLTHAKHALVRAESSAPSFSNKNLNKTYYPEIQKFPSKILRDMQRERFALTLGGLLSSSSSTESLLKSKHRGSAAKSIKSVKFHTNIKRAPKLLASSGGLLHLKGPPEFLSEQRLGAAINMQKINSANRTGGKKNDSDAIRTDPHIEESVTSSVVAADRRGPISPLNDSAEKAVGDRTKQKSNQHISGVPHVEERAEAEKKLVDMSESRPKASSDKDPLIKCASSILQWSYSQNNADILMSEGAVETILRLSRSEMLELRAICSATFKHFSNIPKIREHLVANARTYIPALSELAQNSKISEVSRNCMVALVNLTRAEGFEESLVEDGAVVAMMKMSSEGPDNVGLCALGLYNLSCVPQHYPLIDRILKAIVSLTAINSTLLAKYFCIAGIGNLANFTNLHSRLIEEGVILAANLAYRTTLQAASGNSTNEKDKKLIHDVKKICASLLVVLAENAQERVNLVNKGILSLLVNLGEESDDFILSAVSFSLVDLSRDPLIHMRLVNDGILSILCKICMACRENEKVLYSSMEGLCRICENAHVDFSMRVECVHTAITLLESCNDEPTVVNMLLLLCRVLTGQEPILAFLVNGLPTLKRTVTKYESSDKVNFLCSQVLLILSSDCAEDILKSIVEQGAFVLLLSLGQTDATKIANTHRASVNQTSTLRSCASIVSNFSVSGDIVRYLVADGVISFILLLLELQDNTIVKHCCLSLCSIGQESSNCQLIIESGIVPLLLQHVERTTSDAETKLSCCAVLTVLSEDEACHEKLHSSRTLSTFILLSDIPNDLIRMCCTRAFSNFSYNRCFRELMIDSGIVKVISKLSNSYKEEILLYSAVTLRNLACHEGKEVELIQQGAAKTVMMITMVQSVAKATKKAGVITLYNLVTSSTVDQLLQDGLLDACTYHSKISDENCSYASAHIFAMIATSEVGRRNLSASKTALRAVFNMLHSKNPETRNLIGRVLNGLLLSRNTRETVIDACVLSTLSQTSSTADAVFELQTAMKFLLVLQWCSEEKVAALVGPGNVSRVLSFCRSADGSTRWTSLRSLHILVWNEVSRHLVPLDEAFEALSMALESLRRDQQDNASDNICPPDLVLCTSIISLLCRSVGTAEHIIGRHCVRLIKNCGSFKKDSSFIGSLRVIMDKVVAEYDLADCGTVGQRRAASADPSVEEDINSVADILSAVQPDSPSVLYQYSVVWYSLLSMRHQHEARRHFVNGSTMAVLMKLLVKCPEADSIAGAIFCLVASDPRDRLFVLSNGGIKVAQILVSRHQHATGNSKAIFENTMSGLLLLSSGCVACKKMLSETKELIAVLGEISRRKSSEYYVKVAMDALNKLSEMSGSADLEEGTVSALIARSFGDSSTGRLDSDGFDSDNNSFFRIWCHNRPHIRPTDWSNFKPIEIVDEDAFEQMLPYHSLQSKKMDRSKREESVSSAEVKLTTLLHSSTRTKLQLMPSIESIQSRNSPTDEESKNRKSSATEKELTTWLQSDGASTSHEIASGGGAERHALIFKKKTVHEKYLHNKDLEEIKFVVSRVLFYQEKLSKASEHGIEDKMRRLQQGQYPLRRCSSTPIDLEHKKAAKALEDRSLTAEAAKNDQKVKPASNRAGASPNRGRVSPVFRKQAKQLKLYS